MTTPLRPVTKRLPFALMLVPLLTAGCLGSAGHDEVGVWEETGTTIHLKMWIIDLLDHEVYPGFEANLWAFCAAPADPADMVSAAAIEYVDGEECSVPGPTLRVQQGDKVIVDFENKHVHHHTIHWHGQHTPWNSDGVPGSTQDPVPRGGAFRYEFIASRAGTLWYHCHVDTQFHLMQGLYGAFIVEPQDQSQEPDVDRDQVLVLSTLDRSIVEATPERKADPHADHKHLGDCGETGVPGCQNPKFDLEVDTYLLNGVSAPNTVLREDTTVFIEPGERIRLRFINAGAVMEAMHPHGHDLTVTHIDGVPLGKDNWYTVDTLAIAPGQRYDAVIEGSKEMEGVWVFHTHFTTHVANDKEYPGGLLTKIVYRGFEDKIVGAYEAELMGGDPYAPPVEVPADRIMTFKEELGTAQEVSASFEVPIEQPCALESVTIGLGADSPSSTMQALNDLSGSIQDADGDEIAALALGSGRYTEWAVFGDDAGHLSDLTVQVSGQSADAVATLTARLVYQDADAATAACSHTH